MSSSKASLPGASSVESRSESSGEASSRAPKLGVSSAMRAVEATLRRIAVHASHTVITGESGVGKEEVAKRLHALAFPGRERPFVAVDCGAVSQALLESELFGHERGAFTGAVQSRRGVFEQAEGGTLFFDEIANMPLAMQMKLLRVLQDRVVTRVGGERPREVDFRLVCATNRDLKQLVRSGEFREDLYYRINVIHIEVPPLRERHEDILWLADRFLDAHNEAHPEASRGVGTGRSRVAGAPSVARQRTRAQALHRARLGDELGLGPRMRGSAKRTRVGRARPTRVGRHQHRPPNLPAKLRACPHRRGAGAQRVGDRPFRRSPGHQPEEPLGENAPPGDRHAPLRECPPPARCRTALDAPSGDVDGRPPLGAQLQRPGHGVLVSPPATVAA